MKGGPSWVFGAVLCASSVASAQAPEDGTSERPVEPASPVVEMEGAEERARIHFLTGTARYEAGAYEDAVTEWQRAYELSGHAEIFRSLSLAHEALGQLREAHDFLRRYLADVEAIDDRADLELHLASLERRMSGREEPNDPAPPPPTSGSYVSSGAIVGFVAAGVGLVTLVVAGGLAINEDLRLRDACASLCFRGAGDDLRVFALVSDLGLGLMLVGAALGSIFLLADRRPRPNGSDDISVAAMLDRDGGGFLVRGRM
ncbi:MAG: hypothetical protein H6719_24510 [Sandaracinaceae bacterium]|nr:hypothetical protein [Sandaracinaceae bacterium]